MEMGFPRGTGGMRRTLLLVLMLVTVLMLAGTASAGKEEGTNEIFQWGDFKGIKIDTGGSDTEVDYEVTVSEGARISVYYVPEKGWEEYNDDTSDTFSYVPLWSNLDTRSAKESFTETDGGVWYVIIENSDMSAIGENSTVTYKVTWEETTFGDYMLGAGVCIAIIVVAIIVIFFVRRARREPEVPPMTPEQYQAQQAQQAQQPQQQMPMDASDMGPGYVPPEPGQPPQQPPQD